MISEIELRPQMCGFRVVNGVTEEVENPDFQVLMGNYGPDGSMRQLGYVFFKPKPTINCVCVRCDPPDLARIKELVEEKTGLKFDGIGQAPEMPPEEDDDEEEDDDDEA